MAVTLSSLALQCKAFFSEALCGFDLDLFRVFSAEVGDYEEETHDAAFVSEFRFVPNQNEEFEIDVLEAFKKLK